MSAKNGLKRILAGLANSFAMHDDATEKEHDEMLDISRNLTPEEAPPDIPDGPGIGAASHEGRWCNDPGPDDGESGLARNKTADEPEVLREASTTMSDENRLTSAAENTPDNAEQMGTMSIENKHNIQEEKPEVDVIAQEHVELAEAVPAGETPSDPGRRFCAFCRKL